MGSEEYKEYKPKKSLLVLSYFVYLVFSIIFFLIPKVLNLSGFPMIFWYLFSVAYFIQSFTGLLWYFISHRKQPILRVYENRVVMLHPELHNLELVIDRVDVKNVFRRKIGGSRNIGIKLKDIKKWGEKPVKIELNKNNKRNILDKLVHYLLLKTAGYPISFKELNSNKPEDITSVYYKLLEYNEEKYGFHLFFFEPLYSKEVDLGDMLFGLGPQQADKLFYDLQTSLAKPNSSIVEKVGKNAVGEEKGKTNFTFKKALLLLGMIIAIIVFVFIFIALLLFFKISVPYWGFFVVIGLIILLSAIIFLRINKK